jgi:Domain of unknown function (DUF4349)
MSSLSRLLLLVLLLLGPGCGADKSPHALKRVGSGAPLGEPNATERNMGGKDKDKDKDKDGGGKDKEARGPARNDEKGLAEAPRKIIYTAHLDLIVEDLEQAEAGMEAALEEFKGYIARAEQRGSPGEPRVGTWTLRVPVNQFGSLRKKLLALGEVRRNALDSEDVTDQFYDLQAHLKNDQVQEEGLNKLYLEKSSKNVKLDELMSVLDRVHAIRRTIEVEQGQINRWAKETQFATIHLTMQDRKGYTPPSDPGFGTTLARSFSTSLDALVSFGKGLVLLVVVLVPWLLVLAVVGLIALVTWRRLKRRSAAK